MLGLMSKLLKDLSAIDVDRAGALAVCFWLEVLSMWFKSSSIEGLLEVEMTFCGPRLENTPG